MAWVQPIYDRTEADVAYAKSVQSSIETELKGSMDYRTLNRIEGNTQIIADKINEYVTEVSITTKTDWDREDVLLISELNRVQDNILLLEQIYLNNNTQELDTITFTTSIGYARINAIEEMINNTKELLDGMIGGFNRLSFKLGMKKI